jgi:hypothetical protein
MCVAISATACLAEQLQNYRPRREEILATFGHDFDSKAELVSYLIDLALSLSAEQIVQMERDNGIATHCLSPEQQRFLAEAESIARAIHLPPSERVGIAVSTARFFGSGHVRFSQAVGQGLVHWGINWLPYSLRRQEVAGSFAAAQEEWRGRKERLMRSHTADFRQSADCDRLLFLLALSLSPDQIARLDEGQPLAMHALRPDQRALLEAAMILAPQLPDGNLASSTVRFASDGQFWLELADARGTLRYGKGWLPYSLHPLGYEATPGGQDPGVAPSRRLRAIASRFAALHNMEELWSS